MDEQITGGRDAFTIVVIDDNLASLDLLASSLGHEQVQVLTANHPQAGLELVYKHRPQVVITDLVMPELTGLDVLDRVVRFDPSINVVLLTAHYTTESAVSAIKRGAADYLNKPVSPSALRTRVNELLSEFRSKANAFAEVDEGAGLPGLIGRSPAVLSMISKIRRIAPHFRSVLITGATGTGKDLVAQALHKLSPASHGNFVVLNCSAVVETLFESELFGHVRGAFTGATNDKVGLYEFANNGVLFLDEIGDMPMATQSKLLRVLQNQEIQRVGSLQTRKVNVRVVAATHRDLRAAIAENRFREDLYYRLTMVEISVPPLIERVSDIPLLIRHFVKKFSTEYCKPIAGLTPRAEITLSRHSWPGNVRELENVIGHACMMAASERIDVGDLPEYLRSGTALAQSHLVTSTLEEEKLSRLDEQERHMIADAMASANGNQSEAARILKIGRDALRYKLKKYGIEGISQR